MPWTLSPHPPLKVSFQWKAEQASLDLPYACSPFAPSSTHEGPSAPEATPGEADPKA